VPPAFVGDEAIDVLYEPAIFWNNWLIDSTETSAKPQQILIYDNDIVLRPIPDDTYTIRIFGNKRLDTFSDAASQSGLSDIDGQDGWGEVVAYGTAIDLLVSGGEFEKAAALKVFYDRVRAIAQDATAQMLSTQRSVPSF